MYQRLVHFRVCLTGHGNPKWLPARVIFVGSRAEIASAVALCVCWVCCDESRSSGTRAAISFAAVPMLRRTSSSDELST